MPRRTPKPAKTGVRVRLAALLGTPRAAWRRRNGLRVLTYTALLAAALFVVVYFAFWQPAGTRPGDDPALKATGAPPAIRTR